MPIYQHPRAEQAISLLESSGLPASDLNEASFEHFFGCGTKEQPSGIIGLEKLDDIGLLRSLVIAEENRGKGSGKALVETLERYAQSLGLQTLYLLTDTADRFFLKLGYQVVDRADVPEAIQQTAEFSHLCSDQAVVMKKDVHTGQFMSIYP